MTRLSDLLGYGPRPGEAVLEVPGPLQEAEVVRRPNRFAVELRGGLYVTFTTRAGCPS